MAEQNTQQKSESESESEVYEAVCPPPPRMCFGRKQILSDVDEVTPENVRDVISKALVTHNENKGDIQYLYDVYKGRQAILQREKQIRPEICNRVIVNRSNEVVSFKSSYLMGEPVQYVSSASASEGITKKLVKLNEFMRMEGKEGKDMELANWFHICGVAYRLVLPDSQSNDPYGSPFNIYVLDPRDTFVIRSSGVDRRPLAGVHIVHRKEKPDILCVYTTRWYMELENGILGVDEPLLRREPVTYTEVPIVEYDHNQVRMGAFEPVLSQLDEINVVESNRIDHIEQSVQSLLVFENCEIDSAKYDQMRAKGAINIKSTNGVKANVYNVENSLDQTGVQQTIDDLQASIYDICGMPSTQNGGASTSDTGSAVMLRDGWQQAEARAKETEKYFTMAEQRFLRLVLDICRTTRDLDINVSEVKLQFTRRNYADLLTKSQVLTTLLASNKIAPKLAFEVCTLFTDPEAAYQASRDLIEKADAAAQKVPSTAPGTGRDRPGQPGTNGGQDTE